MATGLLIVWFGEATKFSSALLEGDKTYAAEIVTGGDDHAPAMPRAR